MVTTVDAAAVGVIGLGAMGRPLALRLLAEGHDVVVWNRSETAARELEAAGATWARDARSVGESASVVVTSLPDAAAVSSVLFDGEALAAGLRPDSVVVDTSTIAPARAEEFSIRLAQLGIRYLDAPVSGGPNGAATGSLVVMVGGEAAALAAARAVLTSIASKVVHCGPIGTGQSCKACNQLVVMATIEAVAEALVLAERIGLDPRLARDALLGGYAASRILELHGDRMLRRDYVPGGKARYHLKDIAILDDLAAGASLELPAYTAAARQIRVLVDAGGGDLDHTALHAVLDQLPDQFDVATVETTS